MRSLEAGLRPFLKWIPAALAASVLGASISANAACTRMEFAVVDPQGPRTITGPSGKVLHLEAAPLVTIADFTGANVSLTENQIVLNISLDRDGGGRLRQFSKDHVGTTIAFIVDGDVIKAARILDPIQFDGFLVGPLERPKAEALADAINKSASDAACTRER